MKARRKKRRPAVIQLEKMIYVDYKDTDLLYQFMTEQGKIIPRRLSGTTAKQQRMITQAIKRARVMALLPYVAD